MHSCPHCGSELPGQALFCQRCGEPFSTESGPPGGEPAPGAETLVPVVAGPGPRYAQARNELPIPENIAAVIAYITVIPAIVFAYAEPFRRNLFVRFHAFQHIFLFVAGLGFTVAASLLWMLLQLMPFMRVLVFPFAGLIGLAWFFLWLLLLVKAYHHEWFKLPWVGDLAEEWSRR